VQVGAPGERAGAERAVPGDQVLDAGRQPSSIPGRAFALSRSSTLLRAEGADVRAVTRDSSAARLPGDIDVTEGDPARHWDGVTTLFLHPRAIGDAAGELVALAGRHGVRRVVALPAMNVDYKLDAQPSRFRGDRNKEAEDAAVGSGLEWVSQRAGSFASNACKAWGAQIRTGDVVRGPYANFAESPPHEGDLAEVGARAMLTDEHGEMVAVLGEALGKPLRYQEIPPEVARRGMVGNGFPEAFAESLLARYANGVGEPAPVTGEVDKILGRPASTFAEWAADNAAAFR
jgi:uncharacterized protein YbjT (DUF2867 family)